MNSNFEDVLREVREQHPEESPEQQEARARYRIEQHVDRRPQKKVTSDQWQVARLPWWVIAWGIAVLLLLGAIAAKAEPDNRLALIHRAMTVEAEPQQPSGLIVQLRNQGTVLTTRPAGLLILNCSTNMSCSMSGSTFNITSSSTASTAFSALTASLNTNLGTFSASGNTWDFTAATIFKLRASAALTTSAAGDLGYDTTAGRWHGFIGAADRLFIGSTNVGTSGQVPLSNADGTATFGDPIVSGPTAVGAAPTTNPVYVAGLDGTNIRPFKFFDTDSGVGTDFNLGITLRKSASGGSVELGTSTDPVRTDPTGTTPQPVSGTVTANAGTGTFTVSGTVTANAGTGTFTTQDTAAHMTTAPVGTESGIVTRNIPSGTQAVSGTVTANAGTGTFTVAGTVTSNIGTTGGLALDATVSATQPRTVTGNAASGAADSGNPVKIGGIFNTTQPTVTTGQRVDQQMTARGEVLIAKGISGFTIDNAGFNVTGSLPAGTNNIGGINVAQINGVTPLMGNGVTGTGSQRVTLASDNSNAPGIGASATGSAVPSAARYIAGAGSGAAGAPNLTGAIFCDNWTNINQVAGAQLITGAASKQTHICNLFIFSATAQNVALVEGTGVVCATGTAGLMGGATAATGQNLAANQGFVLPASTVPWRKTATAADNVCLLQSGTGQVSGVIAWAQF